MCLSKVKLFHVEQTRLLRLTLPSKKIKPMDISRTDRCREIPGNCSTWNNGRVVFDLSEPQIRQSRERRPHAQILAKISKPIYHLVLYMTMKSQSVSHFKRSASPGLNDLWSIMSHLE